MIEKIMVKEIKEKEVVKKVICDNCKKEMEKGLYISFCQSDSIYPEDDGYEQFQFCSPKCLGEYLSKLSIDEIDRIFTIDVYQIPEWESESK